MKTLFVGQNNIHLKVVDSTNSYATEMLLAGKPAEGTLIYTFDQQKGRGQRGNSWESEPNKNGAFSYILYPTFILASQQFLLSKMVALAVTDLMADLLPNPDKKEQIRIKWPNNIYIGSQKIAGILIENTLREQHIQHSVIGIGININQHVFSPGLRATSMSKVAGMDYEPKTVMNKLSEFIEARYLQLKNNQNSLDDIYQKQLYQLNIDANYTVEGVTLCGRIKGVNTAGKLIVEFETKEVREFDLKEIVFQ